MPNFKETENTHNIPSLITEHVIVEVYKSCKQNKAITTNLLYCKACLRNSDKHDMTAFEFYFNVFCTCVNRKKNNSFSLQKK